MGGKLTYPHNEIPADKTFIVTGGNAGIGYQTAKSIAKLGGRVILACRNEEKAKQAIEKMQKEHEEEVKRDNETTAASDGAADIQPLKVEFMKLDLASLASTMEFINAYKAKGYPLHVLICNAGLGLVPYQKTDDGLELQFETNYLSHFLMTIHLLPLLRESAPNSRIINVTSIVHSRGVLDLKNMQAESSYDRMKFYGNSKVYQIMNMYSLTRRLKGSGISVFSVHPGYVDSNFADGSSDSKLHAFFESVSQTLHLKRSLEDGAMTSLVAALDTAYNDRSSIYLKDCKVATPSSLARNIEKQEQLWDYSIDLLKDHITDDVMKDLQLPKDKDATPPAATQEDKDATPPAATQEDKSNAESKPEEGANKSAQDTDNTKTDEPAESKAQEEAESPPQEKAEPEPEGEEAKPVEKADSKPEENSDFKPEENSDLKPEENSDLKPEEKDNSKPEETDESKPEEKDDPKPEENSDSKPEEERSESKQEEEAAEPSAEEGGKDIEEVGKDTGESKENNEAGE